MLYMRNFNLTRINKRQRGEVMQHKDNRTLHKFPSFSQFYEVHIIYVRKLGDRPRELSDINHPRTRARPSQAKQI